MRESSIKLVSNLSKALPYACLFITMAILLLSFAIGKYDLAIKGSYFFIPVVAASAIAIAKPGLFKENITDFSPRLSLGSSSFHHLVLLFILLYIVSLYLLVGSEARPPSYFILVGVMASLIFVEILACGEEQIGRKNIILFQIILVSANLIFGQTLRLPFYFGWGDIMSHMSLINSILETGRVTPAMLDYQYFPIFHIFGATSTILSGMDIQTSYFIFDGLVFIISIPVIYLLVSQMTRNVHLPLVSALLYSQSREVIFNGMYMITRVMAFVFCFIILYLLIRSRTSLKLRVVTLFFVVPLVLLHQTTLLHFSGILLIFVIIEFLLHRPSWYIGFNYFLFFTVAYVGYWFWLGYPFIEKAIIDLVSTPYIMKRDLTPALAPPPFVIFTSNADLIIMAFLALIGIVSLLRANRKLLTVGTTFSLFSLVAFVVYFSGMSSFLAHFLQTYRLPLLVSPFIAFSAAGGLLLLMRRLPTGEKHCKSIIRIVISLCIVFSLSLSSTIILGNSTDLNLGKILGNKNHMYFTESEIAAFSFAYGHGQNIPYYGDDLSLRYVHEYLGMPIEESFRVFNPESIKSGYMLFRKQELQSRGQLGFPEWVPGFEAQEKVYTLADNLDLQALWEQQQKTFDSGTLYIYMEKTPE